MVNAEYLYESERPDNAERDISDIHDFDIYNPGALQHASFRRQPFRVTAFWGHLKYLVNNEGKPAATKMEFLESVGYIEFAIDDTDYRIYYANGGCVKRILVPTVDNQGGYTFALAESVFHEIHYRSDLHCLVGIVGAGTSIVDPHSGESCSDEYHEIYRRDNAYWGTHGARTVSILNVRPLKDF